MEVGEGDVSEVSTKMELTNEEKRKTVLVVTTMSLWRNTGVLRTSWRFDGRVDWNLDH